MKRVLEKIYAEFIPAKEWKSIDRVATKIVNRKWLKVLMFGSDVFSKNND